MKKTVTLLLVLGAMSATSMAQTYNAREIVAEDMNKASGCEGPYRYDAPAQTPASKGYKPFYISHYGRHGSRYAWNSGTYRNVWRVLDAARKADALTEFGEQVYGNYAAFFQMPLINTGDLTELGMEQHKNIAATICRQFPEIFSEGGKVLARSSTSPRAITSMAAFCTSLQKNAPKADIESNSLHRNMTVIYPTDAPDELRKVFAGEFIRPDETAIKDLRSRHYDDIIGRLFKDRGFMEEIGGRSDFMDDLFSFWTGYHNYCGEDLFEGVFTTEEAVDFWETENLDNYLSHSKSRYQMIPLLDDIVECAESAVNGGPYVAHFRFGHDTVVNALVPLLNINGAGYQPQKAEDVKYWFQTYDCPMAANIQFVLYRSPRNQEILFKVLRNNVEVSLPQLEPVSWPYYRWEDFTGWVVKVHSEHPLLSEGVSR